MKVKLNSHKLTSDELVIYNRPQKVYIPLISGYDQDITILVNKGEYVYKGSIIAKRKGNFRIPIHSSVSGTVIDFEERTCFTGEKVKCVVIENDFKEKIEQRLPVKKNISKYTKEEYIELLKENGIIGLGGAGFPTYVKYEAKINTLIVNAVECEPYVTADCAVIKAKCEEILETIDAILEINRIEKAIIAIKKSDIELKEIFDNFIGTYLKIKLVVVNNTYPMGWERALIKEVCNITYDKLPIEKGVVVNNISTIYAIYEALKYNKPLIERIVTFTGTLKEPRNIIVKIGTPIIEVLNKLGMNDEDIIISGGPMMGVKIDRDAVISANQNCILVTKKDLSKSSICLNCGKCVDICPAKLSPVLIMKTKDKNKLKYLEPNKCVHCGLCSYICPAKIDVRSNVYNAQKILKEGK